MTPGKYDLALYRGDTYRWKFQFWNDDAKTDPADLTGVTIKAEIRDKPQGTKQIVPMTTTLTVPNIIDMVLSATACATLLPKGAWDLQLTYAGGDVVTVLAGAVVVTADVTDSAAPAP
jgi:hypothetical protein